MAARTFTVAQLLDRMRRIGDWQNLDDNYTEAGSYMSSGTLMQFLDEAHSYAWDLYADTDEGWNLTRTTVTVSGGSGSLPSDMGKLRAVQSPDGDGWRTLSRATLDDDSMGSGWSGGDAGYRLLADTIEVVPSDAVSSLRLTYVPCAPTLSSSLQSVSGVNGYDQVTVLRACVLGRIREEKPYGDIQDQLGQFESRFRESILRRDRGTPSHSRDRRDLNSRIGWRRR